MEIVWFKSSRFNIKESIGLVEESTATGLVEELGLYCQGVCHDCEDYNSLNTTVEGNESPC